MTTNTTAENKPTIATLEDMLEAIAEVEAIGTKAIQDQPLVQWLAGQGADISNIGKGDIVIVPSSYQSMLGGEHTPPFITYSRIIDHIYIVKASALSLDLAHKVSP